MSTASAAHLAPPPQRKSLWLHKPRAVWLRSVIFQIHLWSGLLVGLISTVVGFTGTMLVFYGEIRDAALPRILTPPGAKPATASQLLAAGTTRYPNLTFERLYFNTSPSTPAYLMVDRRRRNGRREGDTRQRLVFLNPYTAQVLGDTVNHEYWLDWMLRLHVYLLAGPNGSVVNGIGAALLFILCASGVVVWWPGVRSWKRALQIPRGTRWKRKNYDIHNAVGFFSSLALGAVALTGVYFIFPAPFRAAAELATRTSSRLTPVTLERPVKHPRITPGQALEIAGRELPGGTNSRLILPTNPRQPYAINRRLPSDGEERFGRNLIYIHPDTGKVLRLVRWDRRTAAERILGLAGPVHFGTIGGWPTRILWLFVGLTPGVLFFSGVLMWWNRAGARAWKRLRKSAAIVPAPNLIQTNGLSENLLAKHRSGRRSTTELEST